MNYYNPYFMMAPVSNAARPGILGLLSSGAGRGFSLSSIISGTQKTLGLVNQAIPIVKQVAPVMKNAKTMFRVMNEFKKVDTPNNNVPDYSVNAEKNDTYDETTSTISETESFGGGPTFFA